MTETDPVFEHAVALHRAGQYGPSSDACRQLLDVRPDHHAAWRLHGLNFLHQGRPDAAIPCFSRAIELAPHVADVYGDLGKAACLLGRSEIALSCFQQAALLAPDDSLAHRNLGDLQQELKNPEAAAAAYARAVELDPRDSLSHLNLGAIFHARRQLAPAEQHYRRAIAADAGLLEAYGNLTRLLISQERRDEAVACFEGAPALAPPEVELLERLGEQCESTGRLDLAARCFQRLLVLRPDYATGHFRLGCVFQANRQPAEAILCFRRALALQPELLEAGNRLGLTLAEFSLKDEAIACFRQQLSRHPEQAELHNNLGTVLREKGDVDQALACFQDAIRLRPDYVAALHNLGNLHQDSARFADAEEFFERALAIDPNDAGTHWNRSLLRLLHGRFREGFEEYEWRWKTVWFTPRQLTAAAWEGESLEGKTILVHAEQGLGDTLQFVRYAPLLRRRGARVIVECQKPLVPLLSLCPGIDELAPQGETRRPCDFHAPLLSLPRILRTTLENVPNEIPYLKADAARVEAWRTRLDALAGGEKRLRVGINWQGNPKYVADRVRSIRLSEFLPLAEATGVQFFSLQKGFGREQLATVRDRLPVIDLADELDVTGGAFTDTAAVLMNLDLLITSDTALPHLAGALGVPVWMATSYVPDWRWLLDRDDSPWYPTMRLFRQKSPGDWSTVFQEIREALQAWRPPRD